jgi:hypothetical protein
MKNQYSNNTLKEKERKIIIIIFYSSTLVSIPFIVAINEEIAE